MIKSIHNPEQSPHVEGLWGSVTSTIDWCEWNYNTTPMLAEFFNATSNVPMLSLGLWTLYHSRNDKLGKRFEVASLFLVLVAVGSFLFHGTLKFEAQLLDELPMVYLGLTFVYCMVEDGVSKKYPWLAAAMVVGGIAHSLAYAYNGRWILFFLPFTILLAPNAVYFLSYHRDKMAVRNGLMGNLLFLVAFISWHLDQRLCPTVEYLQLHAVWHLLTAFSGAINITFFAYVRHKHVLGQEHARIEYRYLILPVCMVNVPGEERDGKKDKVKVKMDVKTKAKGDTDVKTDVKTKTKRDTDGMMGMGMGMGMGRRTSVVRKACLAWDHGAHVELQSSSSSTSSSSATASAATSSSIGSGCSVAALRT